MILALDLSLAATGYSIFDLKGQLYAVNQINPPSKLSTFHKIHYVVKHLTQVYSNITDMAIEDTFLGRNFRSVKELSRLAGAVIYSWIEKSGDEPTMYMATSARKLVGIDVRTSKADTQLYVLERFYPEMKSKVKELRKVKESLYRQFAGGKITKKQLERKIVKFSLEIAEQTSLTNDRADSIIIGLAHCYRKKILK